MPLNTPASGAIQRTSPVVSWKTYKDGVELLVTLHGGLPATPRSEHPSYERAAEPDSYNVGWLALPDITDNGRKSFRRMAASSNLDPSRFMYPVKTTHGWSRGMVLFLSGLFDLAFEDPFRLPGYLNNPELIRVSRDGNVRLRFPRTSSVMESIDTQVDLTRRIKALTHTTGLSEAPTDDPHRTRR